MEVARFFIYDLQVVDCRICGDPHSVLRFAFVEFADDHGARAALSLGGTMLGYYPVKVLPSKTAILPVNPTFLPRVAPVGCFPSEAFGDNVHSTRIAFVEFTIAESAIMALNCSGMILGTQPIRY
ncbi:Polyadenylate-binding protein-interacting protein 8 [Bienertia sinuspersici]